MKTLIGLILFFSSFAHADPRVSDLKKGSRMTFSADLTFDKGNGDLADIDLGRGNLSYCDLTGKASSTVKKGTTFSFEPAKSSSVQRLVLDLHEVNGTSTLQITCGSYGSDWLDESVSEFKKLLSPQITLTVDDGVACPHGVRVPINLTNLSMPTQSAPGDLATFSFDTLYGNSFEHTLKEEHGADKTLLNMISNNEKAFYGWETTANVQTDSPRYMKTTYFVREAYAVVLIPVLNLSCYEMGLKIQAGQIKESEFISFGLGEKNYEVIWTEPGPWIRD